MKLTPEEENLRNHLLDIQKSTTRVMSQLEHDKLTYLTQLAANPTKTFAVQ